MTDPRQQANEALHFQPEWCRVTLASIGDAVITTDIEGRGTFLNSVAETLTAWTLEQAAGQPLDSGFRSISEESRQPVDSRTVRALREGVMVGVANHTMVEQFKDFARVQAGLTHSLLLLLRGGSVASVTFSITPTVG